MVGFVNFGGGVEWVLGVVVVVVVGSLQRMVGCL